MSIETAQEFAAHLHHGQYDKAAELLAEDCTYHHNVNGLSHGRHAIIDIYRQSEDTLRKQFAEVELSSRLEQASDGLLEVHFHDKVREGDRWHELKSYDTLTLVDSKIVHIEHRSHTGEEEAFRAFSPNRRTEL